MKNFKKYLKTANENQIKDLLYAIKNRKLNWNKRLISLSKKQIKEIVDFQIALHSLYPNSNYEKVYLSKEI